MNVPLFDLKRQNQKLKKEFLKSISIAIDESEFVHGEAIKEFEKNFANYCNSKYCLAVNSGTTALILALKAIGVSSGDEIITTPCTFSATSDAVVWLNAKPVFVDVDEKTGNIDPSKIEARVNKKTKAILVVHLYGIPCEMDEINRIAKKHKLKVVEDASHAHGSEYKGRKVGGLADISCFSAYPSKTLGSFGNAGMIVSNNKKFMEKAREFADNGVFDPKKKYFHNLCGINGLINNFQAISLILKLKEIDSVINKRLKIAKTYNQQLQELGLKGMFWDDKKIKPSLYVYSFQYKDRDKLREFLTSRGVGNSVYYPIPLHLQKSFLPLSYKKGDFPIAERFFKQTISLPLYSGLSKKEVDYVLSSLVTFFKKQYH
ncbi:MAG: Pleiotropic regulatory protein [Candidatus Pacebacteria bacterium GW2011_GWF2_38_9]|nr:MAG: pleiotropic regulatory protein [candidate division TM6 bacterium GW2011_GWF2_28_16]KKQ08378.1 MAG: Pleiotropic regulatory protein [Candidatus Pacebacteria bacterium GW2011_GWF1_36_5]KKQ88446.1 MAG: Pleiotropic regulatory protein [Candidatus Pacebacteria bacterium GW2011_GWF2_38_9]HAZ73060.1 transcriptional regulator [Candidatus Paceibacterota bacterium]